MPSIQNNMNETPDKYPSGLSPEEIHTKIAALRARLQQDASGQWPEKVDKLLKRVLDPGSVISSESETMLSVVANDALKGIDIQKHYPAFYQQLLENAALREAFLDIMEMSQEFESDIPLPHPQPELPPEFLSQVSPRPVLELSADKWRATWQQTAGQLSAILLAHGPQLAYRQDDLWDDPWFVLFRSKLEFQTFKLDVYLEATQLGESPDELQLALNAAVLAQPANEAPALMARLQWGQYDQQVHVDQKGRAAFPPIPLAGLLDEQSASFAHDLRLTLEPLP